MIWTECGGIEADVWDHKPDLKVKNVAVLNIMVVSRFLSFDTVRIQLFAWMPNCIHNLCDTMRYNVFTQLITDSARHVVEQR